MTTTRQQDTANTTAGARPDEHTVLMSMRFLFLSFTACVLVAFAVGQIARHLLLEGPRQALLHHQKVMASSNKGPAEVALPPPLLPPGKEIPRTVYTSKNFDTARTATSSSLLVQRSPEEIAALLEEQVLAESQCRQGGGTCPRSGAGASAPSANTLTDGDEDEEAIHLPAGQHLLVDMKKLSPAFLNSEERLARAMVEVVQQADLTLLSYHCHSLVPSGVSCVGVLLESHVSFHTWPEHGVITLDLFTCGSNPLVPVVSIIERLFGVPGNPKEEVVTRWSHKIRGFGREEDPLGTYDLGQSILGELPAEYKKEVVSLQTKYQQIDVWDILYERFGSYDVYERSLSNDGSYYAQHPEFYAPDRIILLDGVLQSRLKGEAAYHESLVHPAMLTHPEPKRVAIVGGGEGATLREVLKHNTVEFAKMIDIDEEMVRASRQYIPDWSDCSDLVGSADWCVDDPRASVEFTDGLAWFRDKFGGASATTKPFDVIIMDALDPQDDIPFAKMLYADVDFIRTLYNSLSEDGVYVVQVGFPPHDVPEKLGVHENRARLIELLEEVGFESLHVYGESHSFLFEEWNYFIALKSKASRTNFYRNSAEVDLELRRRLVRTKSGLSSLKYFDAATMQNYLVPSRPFEKSFCMETPRSPYCDNFRMDPSITDIKESFLEVKESAQGDGAGRGVFAKVDIAHESYIALESDMHPVTFMPFTKDIATQLYDVHPVLGRGEVLLIYMAGYGYDNMVFGRPCTTVDAGISTFVNHGCNGTYNTGEKTEFDEFSTSLTEMPADAHVAMRVDFYNPVMDRHLLANFESTIRDIKAGEELLTNYLAFTGAQRDWAYDIKGLREQCSGEGVGTVLLYEQHDGKDDLDW